MTSITRLHQTYLAESSASGCIIPCGRILGLRTTVFANRVVIGFPLDMTYTAQNSGADLIKQDGTSGFRNFLQDWKIDVICYTDYKAWKLWGFRSGDTSYTDLIRAFLLELPTTTFWTLLVLMNWMIALEVSVSSKTTSSICSWSFQRQKQVKIWLPWFKFLNWSLCF